MFLCEAFLNYIVFLKLNFTEDRDDNNLILN